MAAMSALISASRRSNQALGVAVVVMVSGGRWRGDLHASRESARGARGRAIDEKIRGGTCG